MESGLAHTFRLLTETKNEAALEILLSALDSSDPALQLAGLRALLERRSLAGHRELLRRWHQFSPEWKALVAERATRMEGALRAAILCTEPELHQNACDAVVHVQAFDLIPTLITAAEDKGNTRAELAGRAVLCLCEQLYEELASPRDYRKRRDPARVRQFIYSALETAVSRFDQHRRVELVEAFLVLAECDDPVVKQLLRDQRERVYSATVSLLAGSSRPGVIELVLDYLDDPHAPPAFSATFSRRRDLPFLKMLFERMNQELTQHAKANLRKIDSVTWLREDMQLLPELSDHDLCGAIHFVMASGINRLRAFEVLKFAMRHGGPISRRAASAALAPFKGNEANELALAALDDPDPEVQANIVKQLRDRGIPGIMLRLVDLVDSPHEMVRQAARQSLTEFNFQRYLSAFEMLEPEVRRCSGTLVKRVDPEAIDHLLVELVCPSRSRRLRGIEVAVAMGAVREVESKILELAHDLDHFIRAEAARALLYAESDAAREVLHELLLDRSVSVQEAAQETLKKLGIETSSRTNGPPVLAPPLDLPASSGTETMEAIQ